MSIRRSKPLRDSLRTRALSSRGRPCCIEKEGVGEVWISGFRPGTKLRVGLYSARAIRPRWFGCLCAGPLRSPLEYLLRRTNVTHQLCTCHVIVKTGSVKHATPHLGDTPSSKRFLFSAPCGLLFAVFAQRAVPKHLRYFSNPSPSPTVMLH